MKQRYLVLVLVALFAAWGVPAVFAQATGSVKGVCKDQQGNPIAGATVTWFSPETGRKYELKTNKKGEYFSLGIAPAQYTVTLSQDGKEIFHFNNVKAAVDENTLDFDLKKEQSLAAQGQGISAEELKRRQEAAAKEAAEVNTIKSLNDKLAASREAEKAGNYDQAIALMTEATQADPTRDILWATLADAYRVSAPKQTDLTEKTKRYSSAVDSYQKALDAKKAAMDKGEKDPDANKKLAAYYNNLADAQGKAGKAEDAIKSYGQAATLDPAGAGTYYFNLGAILTNANKADDAVAAFDKAIAADPSKADAYYWKGVNLVAKATTDKAGKVIPAPGTEEALNKYLELQPTGPYAEGAKGMLQYIGSSIETSFGKQKKPAKK
jgi:tetratricopeptide (TPR) repeat protein